MTKEIAGRILAVMPETFHVDELFERIILAQKIEEGVQSLREGKGIPHEEVKRIMKERIAEYRKAHAANGNNLDA